MSAFLPDLDFCHDSRHFGAPVGVAPIVDDSLQVTSRGQTLLGLTRAHALQPCFDLFIGHFVDQIAPRRQIPGP